MAVTVEFDAVDEIRLHLFGEIGGVFDRAEDPQLRSSFESRANGFREALVRDDPADPSQVVSDLRYGHPAIRINPVGNDIQGIAATRCPQRLLIVRGYGEADVGPVAELLHGVEHGAERRDVLRGEAGHPGICAPFDDLGIKRVIVHDIVLPGPDPGQGTVERIALIAREFVRPAIDAPRQDFVIGSIANGNQTRIAGPRRGIEIHFMTG
tara:strand:+ start:1017 stop:1646 length:630 start_codon:yes stop_codon:yes gene_type:complete